MSAQSVGWMAEPMAMVLACAFVATALGAWALARTVSDKARRYQQRFRTELGAGLRQGFLFIDIGRAFRLNLLAVGVAAVAGYGLTGQPLVVFVVLLVAGALPTAGLAWFRRRRLARLTQQLPDAVMLIAGSLRVGSSLPQALAQAARELPAPAGQEFGLAVREQRLGVSLEESMAHLERRVPLPEMALFAAAVRIAQETGGNLAETLERLADTLRRKLAVEGKIDALTAQGRLQGWVMALMPIAIAGVLFVIEPHAMRPLVTTWQGWAVCLGVLGLEAMGLYFIRRIVRIDV